MTQLLRFVPVVVIVTCCLVLVSGGVRWVDRVAAGAIGLRSLGTFVGIWRAGRGRAAS